MISVLNAFYTVSSIKQSLFRKLVECGLKQAYQNDEDLKMMFKKCIALALMPKNKVCEVFMDLIIQKSDFIIERNPRFQELIEYITVIWIEE